MVDPTARAAGREALIAWGLVLVIESALSNLHVTLPAIGDLGSALVAVMFLYTPVAVAWRRKEELETYGFHAAPVKRGLLTAGAAIALVFPLFVAGYFAFYEVACHSSVLVHLVPNQMCARYTGIHVHAPPMSWINPDGTHSNLFEWCAIQLVVVALPEELFFRGMLLHLLEKRFPPKRRILGGGIGWALVLSSAAFAIVHLPFYRDPRMLATFFPGLLFGWMRSATGSILASTVTHGASNILIRLLDLMVMR